jgi:hypothetical protein
LAAFSCPQKLWKALIFRGALYFGSSLFVLLQANELSLELTGIQPT